MNKTTHPITKKIHNLLSTPNIAIHLMKITNLISNLDYIQTLGHHH